MNRSEYFWRQEYITHQLRQLKAAKARGDTCKVREITIDVLKRAGIKK